MKNNDTYHEPILIETPGAIIRVYHPELTEQERNRRMKAIHNAAAELLKEVERKKR
jgi:ribosome recycling factor